IEPLEGRRRVADVEAGDRPAVDLAGQIEGRIGPLHGERLLVVVDEHDLASTGGDAERRAREGAEDVDDHRVPRSRTCAFEERCDPDVQSTAALNGLRPVWNRSSERSRMSIVRARPSSISSTTSCAVAGACMNPWPLNPAAR